MTWKHVAILFMLLFKYGVHEVIVNKFAHVVFLGENALLFSKLLINVMTVSWSTQYQTFDNVTKNTRVSL